jgi:hypothetical protein
VSLLPDEIEISDDVYLLRKEAAEAYKLSLAVEAETTAKPSTYSTGPEGGSSGLTTPEPSPASPAPVDSGPLNQPELFPHIEWSGNVPAQKWMNFYTKVVSKFAAGQGVKLKVTFEATPEGGVSKQKLEETRAAIRELGLDGDVSV